MADASKFNVANTDASRPNAADAEAIIVMLPSLMTTCWLLILPFRLYADAAKPNADAVIAMLLTVCPH